MTLPLTQPASLATIAAGDSHESTIAHWQRAIAIFCLLFAVYCCTFAATINSTDEMIVFDGAVSFAKFGDFDLRQTNELRSYSTLAGNQAVETLDIQPLQMILSAPLVWIARAVPGIGIMHAVWTFNLFVTALTGALLYWYGITLRYKVRTAVVVALLFGLGTYAWVYTQMYFREPLFTLFAVGAALSVEHGRQRWDRGSPVVAVTWWLVALGCLTGALYTKDAGWFLFVPLAIIAIPARLGGWVRGLRTRADLRWRGLLAVSLLLAAVAVILPVTGLWSRLLTQLQSTLARIQEFTPFWSQGIGGYFFSPGFSIWAISPVLLLGLVGAMMSWRRGQIRLAVMPLSALLIFGLGYATIHGRYWYGGAGWGARFLLPTVPFLALWLLPLVESFLRARWRPLASAGAVGLTLFSVVSQLLVVLSPLRAFPNHLGTETARLGRLIVPWIEGTWDWLYLPHTVLAHQYRAPSEVAWMVTGTGWIVVPLCAVVAGFALIALRRPRLFGRWTQAVLLLSAMGLWGVSLRCYTADVRLGGNNPTLRQVIATLEANLQPGDAVLLDSATYRQFFFNEYRGSAPLYVLPNPKGEMLSPGVAPEVTTIYPDEAVNPYLTIMLPRLATQAKRWWYLTEFTPFTVNRTRSTEHYLARHFFPASTAVDLPDARLLLYAPIEAPADRVPPYPRYRTDLTIGPTTLLGYDVPRGSTFRAGDAVPISLLWQFNGWSAQTPPLNYSVNVSIVGADGVTRAQRSGTAAGTFGDMLSWQAGGLYRDNHALYLPADTPRGQYEVWVLLVDWRDGHRLPISTRDGAARGDYAVLFTVTVE